MRILVAVTDDQWTGGKDAAALGATLSSALADRGRVADVEVLPAGAVGSVAPYGCVVAGRTIYTGQWTAPDPAPRTTDSDVVDGVGTAGSRVDTAHIGPEATTAADWAAWVDSALSGVEIVPNGVTRSSRIPSYEGETTMTTPEQSGRHRVVVGVDGSAGALDAVRWAAADAASRGLPLRLVHAVAPIPLRLHRSSTAAADTVDRLVDQGRAHLDEAAALALHVRPGLDTEQDVRVGQPAEVLLDAAADSQVLVTGSRGLGGFRGLLMGSVSAALAHHTRCPLVVARHRLGRRGPVVVGVDGTPASEAALAFAFEEASLRRTSLIAAHTWSDVGFAGLWTPLPVAVDWDAVTADEARLLDERMAGWQEKYPDVDVHRVIRRGQPAQRLLELAQDAALLVVGSREHHPLAGLGLGSTSNTLLHNAECPIAIVRPHR